MTTATALMNRIVRLNTTIRSLEARIRELGTNSEQVVRDLTITVANFRNALSVSITELQSMVSQSASA